MSAFLEIAQRQGRTVVTVCLASHDRAVTLASYHGEITYDTAEGHLVGAVHPSDGIRVENLMSPGRVNFAGAGTSLTPGAALSLTFSGPGGNAFRAFRHHVPVLTMLELNGADGRTLLPARTSAPAHRQSGRLAATAALVLSVGPAPPLPAVQR